MAYSDCAFVVRVIDRIPTIVFFFLALIGLLGMRGYEDVARAVFFCLLLLLKQIISPLDKWQKRTHVSKMRKPDDTEGDHRNDAHFEKFERGPKTYVED